MTLYNVTDNTSKESETFFTATAAKKWMRERIKQGHEVYGSKTKVYSNGDWVPLGEINLNGSNKAFVANSRMTKPNY